MVEVKIKQDISLGIYPGDDIEVNIRTNGNGELKMEAGATFEFEGKDAEQFANRLSKFPDHVEIVGQEQVEAPVEHTEAPQIDETDESEQVAPVEEKTAETVDYEAMTIPEIKAELTEKGIEFDSHAKKSELIELLSKVGE